MSTLGDRLRKAREKKGLKQTQVKERTNINNKTLSGYENNVSEPDSNTLATLADLYEVSYRWLLSGKGEMSAKKELSTSHTASLTEKDEKDIAKRMEKLRKDLKEGNSNGDGLNFLGEPMSEEAVESLLESLEILERQTTLINKKFIPKKHRDN